MWQFPECDQLLNDPAVRTVAFHQHDFGTTYAKPTRLMLLNVPRQHDPSFFAQAGPSFDEQGYYEGPLPRRQGLTTLQRSSTGFGTTGTEQWPSMLCKWVAQTIIHQHLHAGIPDEGGELQRHQQQLGADVGEGDYPIDYPINQPESDKLVGGRGDCRVCRTPGKTRPYNDGAGLVSAGRCDIEQRC